MPNNLNLPEITVVGAGAAGLEFIKKARELNNDIKITLIDRNTHAFDKENFIRCLDFKNNINLTDFAAKLNVRLIRDSLNRINIERKKLYFKQVEPIGYELLVVATGLKSKDISIKGDHREGLVYLSDIKPLEIKGLIKISSEIVIYATTILGLRLAASLRQLGKEVRVLGNNFEFLGLEKERIVNFFSEKGINVHLDVSIEEVIGESQVTAIKVTPLKVYSSELVFIDSGFMPNFDFFEQPINMSDTFPVCFSDIYVIGDASRKDIDKEYFYEFNQEEAIYEADCLAEKFFGVSKANFERKVLQEEDKKKIIEDFLKEVPKQCLADSV
ncbi:MAG: FAD-dependent oxidoreductase [Candidatus Omnitrophota bacterium]